MAMYIFAARLCEAKFCGVPSCVFEKLGCAAGEEILRNTGTHLQVHNVLQPIRPTTTYHIVTVQH
jgi:hypothetical protein